MIKVNGIAETNRRTNPVIAEVEALIAMADEDARHALAHKAFDTVIDDERRIAQLTKARDLLKRTLRA